MFRISRLFLITVGLFLVPSVSPAGKAAGNKYVREYKRFAKQAPVEKVKPPIINDVYVIHFILDGTNFKTMRSMIDQGKMPTLKTEIMGKGATFTRAVSTFPSTSSSAYQSYVTGLLAGHSGIPHLQRLDRQRKKRIDYLTLAGHGHINGDLLNLDALQNPDSVDLDNTATIFELLKGHPTLALYTSIHRGASIKKPKHAPIHALWSTYVTGSIDNVDRLAFKELVKQYSKNLPDIPRYTLIGLYSTDISGHFYGADSIQVEEALIQFDRLLYDFLELLKEQGIREKMYIIVSADHGMHNTDKLFRFRETMIERGLDVKPKNPRIKDFSIYAADRGISSTHVYTRRRDGSFAPLSNSDELRRFPLKNGETIDLINFILSLEPTELVAVRHGENAVNIYKADGGSSRIECFMLNYEQWCSYHILSKDDPLKITGTKARKLVDGRPHSAQEWKHATVDEFYPDAIVQLGTLFQDGRGGDLFIIPKRSWGLRKVKHATHGSLIGDDMRIPLFIAGPDVPQGVYKAMRTVDVYPLLIKWYGLDVSYLNNDGVDPFQGYTPEDPYLRQLAQLEKMMLDQSKPKVTISGHRKKLIVNARQEKQRLTNLERKLNNYINSLEKQLNKGSAPKVTDDDYAKDHLEIARRICNMVSRQRQAMDKIINTLSNR